MLHDIEVHGHVLIFPGHRRAHHLLDLGWTQAPPILKTFLELLKEVGCVSNLVKESVKAAMRASNDRGV